MFRDLMTALGEWLRAPDRQGHLRRMLDEWSFQHSQHPPALFLPEVFPSVAGATLPVLINVSHPFELPYGERLFLQAAMLALRPRVVFEFGTYTGSTTVTIARSLPEGGVVHTLDLPEDEIVWGDDVKTAIGREILASPDIGACVVQHRCNSRRFDYSPFRGQCDLVYVDGSHEYEDVVWDSRRAVEMLAPGGMIIWDDYKSDTPGVWRALQHLSPEVPFRRVAQTRLAFFRS